MSWTGLIYSVSSRSVQRTAGSYKKCFGGHSGAGVAPRRPFKPALFHLLLREGKMSESSSKRSQPLASRQEMDSTEKSGRGRPRKQPLVSPRIALVGSQKEPSKVPTPKRPWGQPKGSKNKGAAKTRKTTTTPGRKPSGRPKKLEKEEEGGISQESSQKEQ
ncbi:high mobility group protein HMG-I/HMG-Y-like [Macaca fascicularis]|uniref:high mobility group protein HMG-I/HMG-Y-like n=2 Tax=Macaca TaxID=9539 RepID=UPI003D155A80